MSDSHRTILGLAAEIVAAHVRHNDVAIDVVPNLIRNVYGALLDIGGTAPRPARSVDLAHVVNHGHHHPVAPAAANGSMHPTYGQTVFEDRLICMEDGFSMKMLKRHLLTVHGMTPAEYRAKWQLPDDYPMVAATYAKLRSSLAVQSGLGLKPEARPGRQPRAAGQSDRSSKRSRNKM